MNESRTAALRTPVVMLTFNRPALTRRVLDAVAVAAPVTVTRGTAGAGG